MKPTTRDGILHGGYGALVRLLILVASVVSGYLLSVSLSGGQAVGCGPGSACDEVLQSRWAYVLGLPVSALALVVDLTLLFATFACGPKSSVKQRRGSWEIIIPCSALVLGAALWFVGLQAFVLHRLCPWCMAAHLSGAAAAILLLARVPITHLSQRQAKEPVVSSSSAIKLAVAAALAIALLGTAQVIAPQKTYTVSTVAVPSTGQIGTLGLQTNKAAVKVAMSATNADSRPFANGSSNDVRSILINELRSQSANEHQFFSILGGRLVLNLKEVPLWGSQDAPTKLVSLYDYTCHHCREMHPHVVELRHAFGEKLAIVSLPVPLDSQCNPLLRQTPRPHLNACTYAKLGLIVWRAKRNALEPFDNWLFGFPNPPPLTDVTNKAIDLVGVMAFDVASRDPWIEQQLKADVEIYATSSKEVEKMGRMPQFMIGSNVLSGVLTTEQLRGFVAPHVSGP